MTALVLICKRFENSVSLGLYTCIQRPLLLRVPIHHYLMSLTRSAVCPEHLLGKCGMGCVCIQCLQTGGLR